MSTMTEEQKVRLLASCAYPPTLRDMCGNPRDKVTLEKCALGEGCEGVEAAMAGFRTLGPYIKFLMSLGAKTFGDAGLAYWVGSRLLEKATPADFAKLVDLLESDGDTAAALIQQYRRHKPQVFVPHHTWQVLLAAKLKAKIEGEPISLANVNLCIPRTGTVVGISATSVEVKTEILVWEDHPGGQLAFKEITQTIPLEQTFPEDLELEDTLIMHWGWICWKSTQEQHETLEHWNKEIVVNYGLI